MVVNLFFLLGEEIRYFLDRKENVPVSQFLYSLTSYYVFKYHSVGNLPDTCVKINRGK